MVLHERVHAGIFNPGLASVIWNARRGGLSPLDFTVLGNPLAIKKKHIAIAKHLKQQQLIEKINMTIDKLNSEGVLD